MAPSIVGELVPLPEHPQAEMAEVVAQWLASVEVTASAVANSREAIFVPVDLRRVPVAQVTEVTAETASLPYRSAKVGQVAAVTGTEPIRLMAGPEVEAMGVVALVRTLTRETVRTAAEEVLEDRSGLPVRHLHHPPMVEPTKPTPAMDRFSSPTKSPPPQIRRPVVQVGRQTLVAQAFLMRRDHLRKPHLHHPLPRPYQSRGRSPQQVRRSWRCSKPSQERPTQSTPLSRRRP